MGTWGTAISSNDTFADIYGDFFDLYNEGLEVSEISKKLISDNQETVDDPDDSNNFWFALAKAQWECKQLESAIFDRVKKIIESGADLDVWRQLESNEKDIKKRKVVLEKFLTDIQTERPKPKSRKKKVIRQPVFEKGDCITFKLENGNYGGALVLEAIRDTEYGLNLIAATRISQKNKPVKSDFENAEVLVLNFANHKDKINVLWYNPIRHKQYVNLVEKVDKIEVQLEYDLNKSNYGFVGAFDIYFIKSVVDQLRLEEIKPGPEIRKTIKELTKKSKFKFW
jgi:hypothetical protein